MQFPIRKLSLLSRRKQRPRSEKNARLAGLLILIKEKTEVIITSRTNPRVVAASSLKEKKYRDETGLFLIDGKKLFYEAVSSGISLKEVFCIPEFEREVRLHCPEIDPCVVSKDILEKISPEKSPDGIVSVAGRIDKLHFFNKIYTNEDFASVKRLFILSGVRDPGNVGTIVRTASAMGIDELIMSSDCADIYSPRSVRASMGAVFRQKISFADSLCQAISSIRKAGYRVLSAVLDESAIRIDDINDFEKTVFVVGNEGHGLSADVIAACDGGVFIPMKNGVESLNVAVASAIFMWHSSFGRK